MDYTKKFILKLFILLFLFTAQTAVNAKRKVNDNAVEFALIIDSYSSALKYPTNTVETSTELLGINWYEPISQYLHAGLEVGYINMTLKGGQLPSAKYSSGQYAGALFRLIPYSSEYVSFKFNMNYRMNRTEANDTTQQTEFEWQESLLSAQIVFRPITKLGISVSSFYHDLSGQQENTGIVSQDSSFSDSLQEGTSLSIFYAVSPSSIVEIKQNNGYKEGTSVYFIKQF